MCLHTRQKKALIAKENIHVFKTMDLLFVKSINEKCIAGDNGEIYRISQVYQLKAKHRSFKYALGKTYTTTFTRDHDGINSGFHSFNCKKPQTVRRHDSGGVIVECVVPKGSQYFLGTNNGESRGIASNKLKVLRIVPGV